MDLESSVQILNSSKKRRGRPRKNEILEKPIKTIKNKIPDEHKEIILHLPVFMNNKSKNVTINNNVNKDKDDESDNDNFDETIIAISNSENDSNNSNDSDISDLKRELKEKNELIKKLKTDILKIKESGNNIYESEYLKDVSYTGLELNLIDNKTGKVITNENKECAISMCKTCWWCTYEFNNAPCFIPERFYQDKYYVFGCFCSYNCAASYNLNMNDYKTNDRYSLIKKIYEELNSDNTKLRELKLAPPKEILKKYGGSIEIEEYRKSFNNKNLDYKLVLPPMISLTPCLETKTIEKVELSNDNIKKQAKKLYHAKNNLFSTFAKLKNESSS